MCVSFSPKVIARHIKKIWCIVGLQSKNFVSYLSVSPPNPTNPLFGGEFARALSLCMSLYIFLKIFQNDTVSAISYGQSFKDAFSYFCMVCKKEGSTVCQRWTYQVSFCNAGLCKQSRSWIVLLRWFLNGTVFISREGEIGASVDG